MTDHTGPRKKRVCQHCGDELPEDATRRRKFCNGTCRKAAYDKRRRQEERS